jgi:predicted CoA-binding protein
MKTKHTLVLGASENTERYSNKAIRSLRTHGHPVTAVGIKPGKVDDVPLITEKELNNSDTFDTVTLYLSAKNQTPWYERIQQLAPKRVIFNPGAENPEWAKDLQKAGIQTEEACTLVLLSTGQY